jgi:hypothetical protein
VWKTLIFEWILLLEFKQIVKIGFGRKNQLSPQYVHIAKFKIFENPKNKECVHNRPNSKVTLVYVKSDYPP